MLPINDLAREGLTTQQFAARLNVSVGTARRLISRIATSPLIRRHAHNFGGATGYRISREVARVLSEPRAPRRLLTDHLAAAGGESGE